MTRKTETDPSAAAKKNSAADPAGVAPEPVAGSRSPAARAAKEREDRLAAALRTNLARRKAAARAATEGEGDDPSE